MNPLAGLASILQGRGRPNPLAGNPLDYQAMLDNAPVGSVGAPSGVMPNPSRASNRDPTQSLLDASAMAPVIGDVMGPIADIRRFIKNPESRTLGNAALFGLSVLPAIPSLAFLMNQGGNAARKITPFSKEAGIIGYHGSPHKFDAFDMSKIGTGEGAQAYGHGLYFAENPGVARSYAETLAPVEVVVGGKTFAGNTPEAQAATLIAGKGGKDAAKAFLQNHLDMLSGLPASKRSESIEASTRLVMDKIDELGAMEHEIVGKGSLYTVDIPDEHIDKMLDWDKPLSEQHRAAVEKALTDYHDIYGANNAQVRNAYKDAMIALRSGNMTGEGAYKSLSSVLGGKENAATTANILMREYGIPGIKYLDAGSRGAGSGTRNFVLFDDKIPKILKRE